MKITKKYVEPKIRFHKLKGSKILVGSSDIPSVQTTSYDEDETETISGDIVFN